MMLFIGKKVIHLVCFLGFAGDPAQRLGLRVGSAMLACAWAGGYCHRPSRTAHRRPVHARQARRKFLGLVLPLGTSVTCNIELVTLVITGFSICNIVVTYFCNIKLL